ncbi:hypothetical protein BSKO_03877 [Bryopsis sp. KO-2023]|nr:hypothetical protein BSKO_03877 [Bryopsis sp. KO-2023]
MTKPGFFPKAVALGGSGRPRVVLGCVGVTAAGVLLHKQFLNRRGEIPAIKKWGKPGDVISDIVCGVVGEIAQILVLYPLDTLKVRCQARGTTFKTELGNFARSRDFASLFAGSFAAAWCSILVGAVYFGVYSHVRRVGLRNYQRQQEGKGDDRTSWDGSLRIELVASVCSCIASALVDTPIEMLRHQAQAGVWNEGMVRGLTYCFKKGGVRALYVCLIPYLIKTLPYDIAELTVHGHLSTLWKNSKNARLVAIPDQALDFVVGGIAGTAAVLSSTPFDCVKTRMEAEVAGAKKGRGFVRCAVDMVGKEGAGALFNGLVPRLLLHVPGTVVYWMVVDAMQRAMA